MNYWSHESVVSNSVNITKLRNMLYFKQFSGGRDVRSFQETIMGNYGFNVSESLSETKKFQIFSLTSISNIIKYVLNKLASSVDAIAISKI